MIDSEAFGRRPEVSDERAIQSSHLPSTLLDTAGSICKVVNHSIRLNRYRPDVRLPRYTNCFTILMLFLVLIIETEGGSN